MCKVHESKITLLGVKPEPNLKTRPKLQEEQ